VEVAPQYDVGDITALVGVRGIMAVLATLVNENKLGTKRATSLPPAPYWPESHMKPASKKNTKKKKATKS